MKKTFVAFDVQIILLDDQDVIRTSGIPEDGGENDGEWM